jgi:pimeloyl-ACP methyl ester carboxylesterase
MRPFALLVLIIGIGLGTLLGVRVVVAAQSATPAGSPTSAASGDFAALVDVGDGRRLWLECRGQGSPTVVLEAAYGDSALIWDAIALPPESDQMAVLPAVASFTRVCAYDRPGTVSGSDQRSRSDPVSQPRTAADAVADLHALLSASGESGPYVLAGHSFGGIIARLYAARFPDEVAGLVLSDSTHEAQSVRFEATLGSEHWAAYERLQQQTPPGLADYAGRERFDLDASFAQLWEAEAAHPLPVLPLVVLTHGVPLRDQLPPEAQAALPPEFPWDEMERVWQALQAELAGLAPGARHVIATESGHYIQLQQPGLVIDAIRQVVAAVRDPGSWATPVATPTDQSGS